MKLILHVVGARPNFMKVAPVMRALTNHKHLHQTLVHTGQHYDHNMTDIFIRQLDLPDPDLNLGVGPGSHSFQTGNIMIKLEEWILKKSPDLVLVYGDVNSTLAAALVCSKTGVPVGHVEAGLRSFDRTMPEEINRVLTDQVSDLLITPSKDADENLLREGVAIEKIHFVGNVMIDTLVRLLPAAEAQLPNLFWDLGLNLKANDDFRDYALVTLHRPSLVDDLEKLRAILSVLQKTGEEIPVIFPVHPRTQERIKRLGTSTNDNGLFLLEPVGYLDFLALERHALFVITDSGGVQEETTYLGIPCLTVRKTTERPVTVTNGTNTVVGEDMGRLQSEISNVLDIGGTERNVPPLWDGRSGQRIADKVADYLE
jgi:UDP-N-acetylglucosamine 2-epimerase (non-hydrolysing)